MACPLGAGAHAMEGAPFDELGRSRTANSFFLEEPELHAWEEQCLGERFSYKDNG